MNASIFGVYGLALRVQMGGSSTSSPGSDPGPGLSNSGPTLTQIMIAGISSGIVSA